MIRIGSNISSLRVQRSLNETLRSEGGILERLSSGMRITKASDDAAGLAIAMSLKSDSAIFSQSIRNLNDGISALTIREGALNALSAIVQRQLELATQASSGIYTLAQRKPMDAEANALVDEFNRILATTTFNGESLFSTSSTTFALQTANRGDGPLSLDLGDGLDKGSNTGIFTTSTIVAAGSGPSFSKSADFNRDGIIDVVTSDNGDGNIKVFIGNGDGSFRAPTAYTGGGEDLILADINDDGNIDIIGNNYNSGVSIFLGNSNGTFRTQQILSTPIAARGIAVGDFNGDGKDDIAVGNLSTGYLYSWLGNGDSTFSARVESAIGANQVLSLSAGDINGDGRDDLVAGTLGTLSGARVLLSQGNSFSLLQDINLTTTYGANVIVQDFNHDGLADLALGRNDGVVSLYNASSSGSGMLTFSSSTDAGGTLRDLELADMNGDGELDFVIGITGSLGFALNDGSGGFSSYNTIAGYSNGTDTNRFTAADFNNDGAIDIFNNNQTSSIRTLLMGQVAVNYSQASLYLLNEEGARSALGALRATLSRINDELGISGAHVSRVQTEINVLRDSKINYELAAERITSADVAFEVAQLTRVSIIRSTAASVLTQANQSPQLALTLLS